MTTEQIINLVDKTIWPLLLLVIYLINSKRINRLIETLVSRIEKGAAFEVSTLKVGQIPVSIPSPKENEIVTENNLALLHSSWRYQKKDKEFNKKMYVIQIIIQANNDVLDRIEYVKYSLHSSYPNSVQTTTDRTNHFQLKELAWGEFNLKAIVKIKEQKEIINLTRYINLTETGENLLTR
jgi:hypothetical protein